MHVKSLKIFCDVVSRRSFSQAAAENGISQSAASQAVHQLEESLGAKLIDRSKRPFVLTSEGEVYYEGCRKLVQRYYALHEEVRTLHQEVEGRVTVATIYSVGLVYGRQLVQQFSERYPKASVQIEYHHPNRVYDVVGEDRAEIGLVSYARSTRATLAMPWRDEPICLVCSPEHELARCESVSLEDLSGLSIVGFDRDLRIRRNLDRELAARGIEVHVRTTFDNTDTIKRAIEVNSSASLLPETVVRSEVESGSLVIVPVAGLDLVRPLGIIHRRGLELGKTARRFIEMLREKDWPKGSADGSELGEPEKSPSAHQRKDQTSERDNRKDTMAGEAVVCGER
jgi:DNA-binding transcriptional LysR family regulator